MRPMFLLLSVAVLLGLAGCSYDPARVSTEPLVILDDDGHGGGGDFCPPGQAKKGNC
ncbi:hypothetical protein [Halomonas nitroreducens]|uniref:hypothetical protein n=1 Tax=Halomonas nitroreducens TaxID=447425 RepID=UPI001639CABD|nr:hypothetical protein [Halomonas nitroreducens]